MAPERFPYVNKANRYARDVVSGKIDACLYVKQACQRHLDDLSRESERNYRFKFDREKGNRICRLAENMPHVKGQWQGSLIQLQPWQCFMLAVLFGWVRKSDGMRRFREIYAEIPRKNAKSTLAAIIGLNMLVADGEGGAEVYSGATSEKQAWEVFRPAKLMAEKSPGFTGRFGVNVAAKSIHVIPTASRFEPVVGNPGDGSSPHCAIVDEYHEHKTSDLYDTMVTGMGARAQPMRVVITTAGTDLRGPCYAKHDEAVKVLSGQMQNDELFTVIYTIDEDDDWADFSVWKKANPNFGVSVFEDFLAERHREATQLAHKQNILRCKHLNQWLNVDTAWMNMLAWKQAKSDVLLDQLEGLPCYIAIDLASKTDIAGMVMLVQRDGELFTFGRYYLPEETINKPDNQHYQTWRIMDRIIETPGAIIDYGYIEDDLKGLRSRFEIRAVAYDPFQATQFSTRMAAEGFPMIEVGATVRNFSEPMKEVEARILANTLHHDGCPVLTWMMSNVVAHYDKKDNIFPNKERAANKIDGAVALIMAMNRVMATDQKGPSVYETRGIFTL